MRNRGERETTHAFQSAGVVRDNAPHGIFECCDNHQIKCRIHWQGEPSENHNNGLKLHHVGSGWISGKKILYWKGY